MKGRITSDIREVLSMMEIFDSIAVAVVSWEYTWSNHITLHTLIVCCLLYANDTSIYSHPLVSLGD